MKSLNWMCDFGNTSQHYWLRTPLDEDRVVSEFNGFAIIWLTICANLTYIISSSSRSSSLISLSSSSFRRYYYIGSRRLSEKDTWNAIMAAFSTIVFLSCTLGFVENIFEHHPGQRFGGCPGDYYVYYAWTFLLSISETSAGLTLACLKTETNIYRRRLITMAILSCSVVRLHTNGRWFTWICSLIYSVRYGYRLFNSRNIHNNNNNNNNKIWCVPSEMTVSTALTLLSVVRRPIGFFMECYCRYFGTFDHRMSNNHFVNPGNRCDQSTTQSVT